MESRICRGDNQGPKSVSIYLLPHTSLSQTQQSFIIDDNFTIQFAELSKQYPGNTQEPATINMSSPPAYTLVDRTSIVPGSAPSTNECLEVLFGQRISRATLLRTIVVLATAIIATILLSSCWYFSTLLSMLISNAGGLLNMLGTIVFCINIMVAGYLFICS